MLRSSSSPRRVFRPRLAVLLAVAATIGAAAGQGQASTSSSAQRQASASSGGEAPGGPGAQSYLDVARKDCFGTAHSTRSKVWFTVAQGVLSDVFSPNLESSNVSSLQYLVTDGRTFADLQQRDMAYSVSALDRSGMVCQVLSTDRRRGFTLLTRYITDPARSSVLVRTALVPLPGVPARRLADLRVYVRFDPTIDNTGGGGKTNAGANDATIDPGTGALVSTDTKGPTGPFAARVAAALVADHRFGRETSGFVGTPSDGLRQLEVHRHLTTAFRSARNGNVVQTALVRARVGRPFTLALGFAPTAAGAVRTALASARGSFSRTLTAYERGWRAYDATLRRPPATLPGYTSAQDAAMRAGWWLSANVLKAAEDKTYAGAFVASPTDPWGQSVPATTTHPGWTYREVFARDSYETFTGLMADGDRASARQMVRFLFERVQQPDGSFPRDSEIDGAVAPDTFGLAEIDQDAYPLLMASEAGLAGDRSLYQSHIRPAADFIVDHGPAYGVERWEEHPGYSPSTIAAEIAGLLSAAQLARAAGDLPRARLYVATADYYQRNVQRWTVTRTGPYAPHRYFLRLSPTGDPNEHETYDLGNGSLKGVDQRRVIDAGFLELTRLGELPAGAGVVADSLRVVDSVLERRTSSGPGWHRYGVRAHGATDGYGDCYVPDPTDCAPTGAPWFPKAVGSGHLWPLLDGERAEHYLQLGRLASAARLALTMQHMMWGAGLVGEQVWEDPRVPPSPYGRNPATASIGFRNGQAAGSATPLIWAQAQYLRLLRDLAARRLVDEPTITAARYLRHGPPTTVPLLITSPSEAAVVSGPTTTVSGTTRPGATVVLAAAQPGSPTNVTEVSTARADARGHFTAQVPTPLGETVITAAVLAGGHASGFAQVTVSHAYASLSAAFDNVGVTSDTDPRPGNLDGMGDSYSAQALAAGRPHPLTPGQPVTVGGATLTWPAVAPGQPDNVQAEGQAIPLQGSGSRLALLGAGALGSVSGQGTITYIDGSRQRFTLQLNSWTSATPAPGTMLVNASRYSNTSTGSGGPGASVFIAFVPLKAGRTVAYVTLPYVSTGIGGVATMHVFALGIQP